MCLAFAVYFIHEDETVSRAVGRLFTVQKLEMSFLKGFFKIQNGRFITSLVLLPPQLVRNRQEMAPKEIRPVLPGQHQERAQQGMARGSGSSQAEPSDAAETTQEQTCMTREVKMTGRQNKDGFPQSAQPEPDLCTK